HFEIKDNGIGMSEEFLKNVFNPFERESTTENIIGSGLGLSITKYLVDIMHGTIEIKSKLNVGTTVIVDVPARATNDENVVKQDEKE
ncbi:MAG: sensor histidine kinase, partial [Clostridia bacterium]